MPWTAFLYTIGDDEFGGATDPVTGIITDYDYRFVELNYHGQGKFSGIFLGANPDSMAVFEALENDVIIPVIWLAPPYGPLVSRRDRQSTALSWDLDTFVVSVSGTVYVYTGFATLNPVLRDTDFFRSYTGSIFHLNSGTAVNDNGSIAIHTTEEYYGADSYRVRYNLANPDNMTRTDVDMLNYTAAPSIGLSFIAGTNFFFHSWTGDVIANANNSAIGVTAYTINFPGYIRNYNQVMSWKTEDNRSFLAIPSTTGSNYNNQIGVYEINRATGQPTFLYKVHGASNFFMTDGDLTINRFASISQRNPEYPGLMAIVCLPEIDTGTEGAELIWVQMWMLHPEAPELLWEYNGKWYEDQGIIPGNFERGLWIDDESCVVPNPNQVVVGIDYWDEVPTYEGRGGFVLISSADKPAAPTDWWEQTSSNIVQGSS